MPETRPWSLTCRDAGDAVLAYRILYRFLASLARLAVRSGRCKDLEIIVLRHQLAVLRRQIDRPELTDADRTLLAAIAAALARPSRTGWLVTPDTLLRQQRRRIVGHWTPTTATARPAIDGSGALPTRTAPRSRESDLGLPPHPRRTARARPPYRRVNYLADPQQRRNRPRPHTLQSHLVAVPAVPGRRRLRLRHYRHGHTAQVLPAVLHRHLYPDACTSQGSRTTPAASGPPKPPGTCCSVMATNLTDARALVRDRGSQFIDAFDEIFRTEGMQGPHHTCTHPRGERVRRTLDRHPATRTPRPLHHLEPSPTREACRRLHRSLQHAPAPPFTRPATTRRHRPPRPAR